MINFFVSGKPVPQARPRTFIHRQSGKVVTMNPTTSEDWKKLVRYTSAKFMPKKPFDGPVYVNMKFWLPRPKNHFADHWVHVRPDIDNYAKGTLDALQKAGFFTDDSRVAWLDCQKLYSDSGWTGVEILIKDLSEEPNCLKN